jgi:hypothetical protein
MDVVAAAGVWEVALVILLIHLAVRLGVESNKLLLVWCFEYVILFVGIK